MEVNPFIEKKLSLSIFFAALLEPCEKNLAIFLKSLVELWLLKLFEKKLDFSTFKF
jgi:hypothetical protein